MARMGDCSRREFCAATGLIVLGASACGGDPRLFTGGIDNPVGTEPPSGNDDLAGAPRDGGSNAPTDLAHAHPACNPGMLDAGLASAIAVGAAKHFSAGNYDLFVCHDAGGYFTVDAQCTHSGCDVKLQGGKWYCPCHSATFNFDGTGPTIPAFFPLANYSVCVDANGHLQVDYNTKVPNTQRA